jgi:hypothetical protein
MTTCNQDCEQTPGKFWRYVMIALAAGGLVWLGVNRFQRC